jgi:hypothetical protein
MSSHSFAIGLGHLRRPPWVRGRERETDHRQAPTHLDGPTISPTTDNMVPANVLIWLPSVSTRLLQRGLRLALGGSGKWLVRRVGVGM